MYDSPIVKTEGLTKRFGRASRQIVAVDDLSITVRRGSIFGFLGPNGAGKTTTIGLLLGLIRATSGLISLFGRDISQDLPSLLRRTSAVLENTSFYPYLTGRQNTEIFARMTGGVPDRRIDEVLETVGLQRRAGHKAGTYSLGMRQRLAIAVALLNDPALVILDEPTNGLDPSGIIEIRNLIGELGRQGKTIFLSSHLLHEVEQVCNHAAILNKGRVIAQGPVDELLHRGRMLRMRVSDVRAAVTLLKDVTWIKTIETAAARGIVRIAVDEERFPDVNEMLVKGGIRVLEMKKSEKSLEDFFLATIEAEKAAGAGNA
ncbi:MAG: ABC transporter ATP-binding protein [Thermodesulfobacteriota bacterium]|nr:ABC transporter ATP-binding protein [Thermodesulfobacteriota bacterium]